MDIRTIISRIAPLPSASAHRLAAIAHPIALSKSHLLFRADRLEHDIYLISRGLARVYYHYRANDVTLCFGMEGDALISLRSYIQGTPGYENIELLETSELYRLKIADLHQLYTHDIYIANWGRKLGEQELIKTEERLMSRQFKSAAERYDELLKNQPNLLQRVQLGHIASYLGISQVTLSRIRAEIR